MTDAPEPATVWATPTVDLSARVVDWFRRNPDEALSTEDIAAKFDWPQPAVTKQLRPAVKQEVLAIQRRYNQTALYSAGPAINQPPAQPEPAARQSAPPARAGRRGSNPPPSSKRPAASPCPPSPPQVHVATHGAAPPAGLVVHVHVHVHLGGGAA